MGQVSDKYVLTEDVPMFRGIIRKGTVVTIESRYLEFVNVVTECGVGIHGLHSDRIDLQFSF